MKSWNGKSIREMIFKGKTRIGGREFDEVRPISCEVAVLPRTHGSALFTRGETQALAVTTLGTSSDEQRIDSLNGETFKSFMLHYNFPPFSVGRPGCSAVRAVGKSGTGRWPKRPCNRCCLPGMIFLTPSVLSRRSWSRTAPPPWPPFAGRACP